MKAYLNYYGETDRILTREDQDPPKPQQSDYQDAAGVLPDDSEERLEADMRTWKEKSADFNARSKFLATSLVQACHSNKKAS